MVEMGIEEIVGWREDDAPLKDFAQEISRSYVSSCRLRAELAIDLDPQRHAVRGRVAIHDQY